ncbi:MAG: hypothetical protein EOP09_13065 [Proteobacteria bacterium]|nr:MAG: hypothetical protein EOP09_13065 [Pseudomonadota bacterium]
MPTILSAANNQCGGKFAFHDHATQVMKEYGALSRCVIDYRTAEGVKCFGRWMMLCPGANVSLALATTNRYFQTKHAAPKCQASFRALAKAIRSN